MPTPAALNRLHTIFVCIGVCEAPKDTSVFKKVLFVFVGIAILSLYCTTMVSMMTFLLQNIVTHLPIALSSLCATSAYFGLFVTILTTFYFRHDFAEVFERFQTVCNKGK